MKKYIIILILISLTLTGCGIYNLNSFILPDDLEFIQTIEELDTPEKIANYMQENFIYQVHRIYAPSPYILWKIKEGDCNDFATFGIFVANYHGFKTWQIIISYKNSINKHAIAIYQEDLLSITNKKRYFIGFNSFEEIANIYPDWSKYIVYDYYGNVIEKKQND